MNEDLKEGIRVLKNIKDGAMPPEIYIDEAKEILNYIDNLQNRIDKAIDELNNLAYDEMMLCKNIDNAILILKGDESNDNNN